MLVVNEAAQAHWASFHLLIVTCISVLYFTIGLVLCLETSSIGSQYLVVQMALSLRALLRA